MKKIIKSLVIGALAVGLTSSSFADGQNSSNVVPDSSQKKSNELDVVAASDDSSSSSTGEVVKNKDNTLPPGSDIHGRQFLRITFFEGSIVIFEKTVELPIDYQNYTSPGSYLTDNLAKEYQSLVPSGYQVVSHQFGTDVVIDENYDEHSELGYQVTKIPDSKGSSSSSDDKPASSDNSNSSSAVSSSTTTVEPAVAPTSNVVQTSTNDLPKTAKNQTQSAIMGIVISVVALIVLRLNRKRLS